MLTDRQCKQALPPTVLTDYGGLRLKVTKSTVSVSKRWLVRYKTDDGRIREAGLGSYPEISLAEARERAAELRREARFGCDPVAEKKALRAARP
ncbi:MAG: DUF4102 domain-containing protein, partial [Alphaproteobacteria bacterium]|nr:DUF4102 domain-containing protein [Alphaproteobacteria bacterium]